MAIRDDLSWEDHFTRASGLVHLVRVAAEGVDVVTRAQLVARAVDEHIEAGIDKVSAELDESEEAPRHRRRRDGSPTTIEGGKNEL